MKAKVEQTVTNGHITEVRILIESDPQNPQDEEDLQYFLGDVHKNNKLMIASASGFLKIEAEVAS